MEDFHFALAQRMNWSIFVGPQHATNILEALSDIESWKSFLEGKGCAPDLRATIRRVIARALIDAMFLTPASCEGNTSALLDAYLRRSSGPLLHPHFDDTYSTLEEDLRDWDGIDESQQTQYRILASAAPVSPSSPSCDIQERICFVLDELLRTPDFTALLEMDNQNKIRNAPTLNGTHLGPIKAEEDSLAFSLLGQESALPDRNSNINSDLRFSETAPSVPLARRESFQGESSPPSSFELRRSKRVIKKPHFFQDQSFLTAREVAQPTFDSINHDARLGYYTQTPKTFVKHLQGLVDFLLKHQDRGQLPFLDTARALKHKLKLLLRHVQDSKAGPVEAFPPSDLKIESDALPSNQPLNSFQSSFNPSQRMIPCPASSSSPAVFATSSEPHIALPDTSTSHMVNDDEEELDCSSSYNLAQQALNLDLQAQRAATRHGRLAQVARNELHSTLPPLERECLERTPKALGAHIGLSKQLRCLAAPSLDPRLPTTTYMLPEADGLQGVCASLPSFSPPFPTRSTILHSYSSPSNHVVRNVIAIKQIRSLRAKIFQNLSGIENKDNAQDGSARLADLYVPQASTDITLGDRNASSMLRKSIAMLFLHGGFDGMQKSACDILEELVSTHIIAVAKICQQLHAHVASEPLGNIALHAISNMTHRGLQSLPRYWEDGVVGFERNLACIKSNLKQRGKELGIYMTDDASSEFDDSLLVTGNFPSELGLDVLGLNEGGLSNTPVPEYFFYGPSSSTITPRAPSRRKKPLSPPPLFKFYEPPAPWHEPVDPDMQIHLLRPFFAKHATPGLFSPPRGSHRTPTPSLASPHLPPVSSLATLASLDTHPSALTPRSFDGSPSPSLPSPSPHQHTSYGHNHLSHSYSTSNNRATSENNHETTPLPHALSLKRSTPFDLSSTSERDYANGDFSSQLSKKPRSEYSLEYAE